MTQYTTQMDAARQGIITPQMEIVAEKEHFDVEELRELIAKGQVIIPCNKNHKSISPSGVGAKLTTKINEGKTGIGRPGPCTPWGKPALGLKTRKKNKPSNKLIVRRRDGKALTK